MYDKPYSNRVVADKWAEKRIRKAMRKFLRPHFVQCTHNRGVRWLMQIIFDELQEVYEEDNIPTTVDFMVEELVNASDMKPSWGMYRQLRDVKDEDLCSQCKGEGEDEIKARCPKCKGMGLK